MLFKLSDIGVSSKVMLAVGGGQKWYLDIRILDNTALMHL